MEAIVYLSKNTGLANRLRALVGYQAMSEILNVPFYLCWVSDRFCRADFKDIFNGSDINGITPEDLTVLGKNKDITVFETPDWFNEIWKQHLTPAVPWMDFFKIVAHNLENLRPNAPIAEKVDHFARQHDLNNLSGMHIRWTDNLNAYDYWMKNNSEFNPDFVSTLDGFKNFMDAQIQLDPGACFFLTTDNRQIEKQLKKAYGNTIITYQKNYTRRMPHFSKFKIKGLKGRTSSIENALIEMLLLSKCKMIVGTYFSSFSKFSAVWGKTGYYEVRGAGYAKNEFMDNLISDRKKMNN